MQMQEVHLKLSHSFYDCFGRWDTGQGCPLWLVSSPASDNFKYTQCKRPIGKPKLYPFFTIIFFDIAAFSIA
jgi:hypothetical protein